MRQISRRVILKTLLYQFYLKFLDYYSDIKKFLTVLCKHGFKVKGAVGESNSLPELSHPFKLASKYIVYSYISHSYMMDVLSYVKRFFTQKQKIRKRESGCRIE